MPSALTRARAWALRTFAGRSRSEAAWEETAPVRGQPPVRFGLGDLDLVVTPVGRRAVGVNPVSSVFEVRLSATGGGRAWTSRYGLPGAAEARVAAATALDELWEIWNDRATWEKRVTEGMSEDEVEAMLDSPAAGADVSAAERFGPRLAASRDGEGHWVLEEVGPG